MYCDAAGFEFVVAGDNKSVVVDLGLGPRFGRGFRYQVIIDDDGRALSWPEGFGDLNRRAGRALKRTLPCGKAAIP